jgi:hypothetical protein
MRGMPYLGPLQTWCVGNIFSSDRLTNCLSWRWHKRQHAATPRLEDLTREMSITFEADRRIGNLAVASVLESEGTRTPKDSSARSSGKSVSSCRENLT